MMGSSTSRILSIGIGILLAWLAATATALVWSTPSPAAFPGHDGRILFSSDRDGRSYEIYSMKPDGGGVRQLTDNDDYEDDGTLSPDAKEIAYRRVIGQEEADIYVMNADGSHQHDISNLPGYDVHPAWSPSGSRIAFVSNHSGSDQIYLMKSDGSNRHPVKLSGLEQEDPVFTPDGRKILFSGGNGHLYRIRPDGTHQRRLTHADAYDEFPDISPSGKRIIFNRFVGMGEAKIFSARADGTHPKLLASGNSFEPFFSPRGNRITFASNQDGPNFEAFVMHADGSHQQRITATTFSNYPTGWGIRP